VLIGRTQGDVLVKEETVSGRHCEIRTSRTSCLVRDLGSTNGCIVNGRNVPKNGSAKLREGDELELGDAVFVLELVTVEEDESSDEEEEEEEEQQQQAAPTGGLLLADIRVLRRIGGGSFGTVFEGALNGEPIVLKQANLRVEGAKELLALEQQLNELAAERTEDAVASFIGAIQVSDAQSKPTYAGGLTAGLWLAWQWQGAFTLQYHLQRGRSSFDALAEQLGISPLPSGAALEAAVTKAVLRQTLCCLQSIHEAGLVHCDIKPANILIGDESPAVRLIDLGGAASCLHTPLLSYAPGEGVHDPLYSPPELNLLSEDAKPPTLRNARGLWREHQPYLFDLYSLGVVLLQLAVPRLRTDVALKRFRDELEACGGELMTWREQKGATGDDMLLGLDDGAGWDLAAALMCPRRTAGKGKDAATGRLSASEALRHPFLAEER